MIHAMLDVEALRLAPAWQAPLMEVGVLFFDGTGYAGDGHTIWIDQKTMPAEFTPEESTVKWWEGEAYWPILKQSMESLGDPCEEAIRKLGEILKQADVVWFAGPTYDQVMIEAYFDHFKMERPWKYNNTRDFRTIRKQHDDIYKEAFAARHGHHCAIEDCHFQVSVLRKIFEKTRVAWR